MILQRMIYPVIGNCKELYYREHGCEIDTVRGVVDFVTAGSSIDFATYFNIFSYRKWNKYTNCGSIGISVFVKGSVKLVLSGVEYADGGIRTVEIGKRILTSAVWKRWTIPFNMLECDFASISIIALEDGAEVGEVAYVTMQDEPQCNDVSLGICICTFKREDEVRRNIKLIEDAIINNQASDMYGKLKIFVSDNASTLEEREDDKIRIFHNKNYGGSGGFTRAAIEAMKSDVTHLLFMDDDISFEIDVLERTYTFLRLLKSEYRKAFLGGGMLISDRQSILHAAGEREDLKGIHLTKAERDLRELKLVLISDVEDDSNYLGWWYCAIPREAFEMNGYSYPMFVMYDDIEQNLRCNDYHKINVSGIGVWHLDFNQKRSSVKMYYTIRNRLISHSLCYGKFLLIRRWGECVLKSFGRMRRGFFFEAMLVLMAGFDYLKGPEYICELDLEQKNAELYAYAKRDDAPAVIVAWAKIVGLWVKLFLMMMIKKRTVIKRYRKSAGYYTSKEYWCKKLEINQHEIINNNTCI